MGVKIKFPRPPDLERSLKDQPDPVYAGFRPGCRWVSKLPLSGDDEGCLELPELDAGEELPLLP